MAYSFATEKHRKDTSMTKYLCHCCHLVFLTTLVSAGELPDDVQRLIEKRGEAIAQIDLKFLRELENLKIKYTKAGDLDSANAIVALIEKTPVKKATNTDTIKSIVTRTPWIGITNGYRFFFGEDDSVKMLNKEQLSGSYKTNDKAATLTISWKNGFSEVWHHEEGVLTCVRHPSSRAVGQKYREENPPVK